MFLYYNILYAHRRKYLFKFLNKLNKAMVLGSRPRCSRRLAAVLCHHSMQSCDVWWKLSAVVPWSRQLHALIRGGNSQLHALGQSTVSSDTWWKVFTGGPWIICVWDSFIGVYWCSMKYLCVGLIHFNTELSSIRGGRCTGVP